MAGSIEVSEEKGVRYLHFGSDFVQGAMRIARPWALELEYTRELLLPLILRDEPPSTVLQIGLGAGSITRYLHRWFPQARNTVVEIDPRVVTTAREFFKLPEESQNLRIVIGEGHDFVAGTKSRFDLVIADGYDERGRTGTLDTVEFYAAAHARLTRRGMMSANLLTRRRGLAASTARMQHVFGENVSILPPPEAGNTVAIMGMEPMLGETPEALREAARKLKDRTGLNLLPTLSRLGF